MRLIPDEKAFAFARKLQGTPGGTVSVCCDPRGPARLPMVAGLCVGRATS